MYKFQIGWLSLGAVLGFVLWECTSPKKLEKSEYEFPSVMKDYVKKDFLRQCLKGEVLYDINCAKCHTVKVKRKMVIPDFTSDQLNSYDMRMANKEHQTNLQGTQVTTEELGYIISFLSYKKKSGVPATGDNLPKE